MGRKLGLCCVLAVAIAGLSCLPSARADGETDPALWIFDLRVVQTTCDAETGMTPSPWEGAAGPTFDLKFEDAVATLKKRGKIFLLMDQRVTALEGVECKTRQETIHPTERLVNKTSTNETRQFAAFPTGCTASLKAEAYLEFQIEAKWPLWPLRRESAVPHSLMSWRGTHPSLDGKTLVLHYRDHNLQETGEPQISEIYCFLTARKAAR